MCTCSPQDSEKADRVSLDVSPEVLKSIAQADLGRKNAQNGSSEKSKSNAEKQLSDQMVKTPRLSACLQHFCHASDKCLCLPDEDC